MPQRAHKAAILIWSGYFMHHFGHFGALEKGTTVSLSFFRYHQIWTTKSRQVGDGKLLFFFVCCCCFFVNTCRQNMQQSLIPNKVTTQSSGGEAIDSQINRFPIATCFNSVRTDEQIKKNDIHEDKRFFFSLDESVNVCQARLVYGGCAHRRYTSGRLREWWATAASVFMTDFRPAFPFHLFCL